MITFRAIDILTSPGDVEWLRNNIKCVLCEDTKGIVAERDGVIVGMMVADSWTENSCQVHQAVADTLAFKHGLHIEFAEYVFGVAGRKMMLGLTPSDNAEAIKLNEHYGFTEFTRVPDAVRDGVDYIVYRMTAADCLYYEEKEHAA